MLRKIYSLALLVSTVCPGAYLVGDVGDDTAFGNYMRLLGVAGYQNFPTTIDYSQELYSIQAKFGNNAAGGNNELGLHWNYAPGSTPPTNDAPITTASSSPIVTTASGSIQRPWGTATTAGNIAAGTLVNALLDFTITRVGNTVSVSFQSGGTPVYSASITDPTVGSVNFIALRARSFANSANTTASRVTLNNIVLNGVAMGSMGNVSTVSGVTTVTNYVIRGVVGDYTLTGQTTLDWSGTNPGNAALALQIKHFVEPVPEPAAWALLPAALGFLSWRRRRR